jgi:MoaA/NifB/PqqE/SkfB family radical SAM enzyme
VTAGNPCPGDPAQQYRELFDTVIAETLSQAIRIIAADPALVLPGTVILHHQRKAAGVRRRHEQQGLLVPPVMIASITSRCNLACAGCYMKGRKKPAAEMSPETLASIARQAAELGVSVIVIAGGEPLVRRDEILRMAKTYPEILFPVFTNGLLIDEPLANAIASCRNIVPVISFEGLREETDRRRGSGVYERLVRTCSLLKDRMIFSGCSLTTTRENFRQVTDESFVLQQLGTGARVFAYVEYVPMEPGTEHLVLTHEQKRTLSAVLSSFNQKFPALFIGFPGDEDAYGGCLAAGRGFVHVSPSGDLEPCPAAPFSDANLAEVSLEEALRSRLLSRIRDEHGLLTETAGGCALRANRGWVEGMMGEE